MLDVLDRHELRERDLAVKLLAEITHAECHFNNIEAGYRKLTSTWLLATFAAMGYIATARDLPLPAGPTIFALAASASIGTQLLWIVDLLTYHQLLLANFLEGVRIERRHPSLPQVRMNMWTNISTGARVRLFYLGSSLFPVVFGAVAYFIIGHEARSRAADIAVGAVVTMLVASMAVLMRKSTGRWVRDQIERLETDVRLTSPRTEAGAAASEIV